MCDVDLVNAESAGQTVNNPSVPPNPAAASASRTFEVLCHVLAFAGLIIPFGNIIGPLVIWLMKKGESPSVDAHGKESLNFQISMTIWTLICAATILLAIGVILVPAAVITN